MTELATGVSPRLAGIKRHCLTASTAASSSISCPLDCSTATPLLKPSAETCTRNKTLPVHPRLLATGGYSGLGL